MTVVDKEWKKLETIPACQLDQVKSKNDVLLEAQKRKLSPLYYVDGHLSPRECRVGAKITQIQRQSQSVSSWAMNHGSVDVSWWSQVCVCGNGWPMAAATTDLLAKLPSPLSQQETHVVDHVPSALYCELVSDVKRISRCVCEIVWFIFMYA